VEVNHGIVGAVAQRNVVPILIEGLQRLEYRGYDSAGLAVRQADGHIGRIRAVGKVAMLRQLVEKTPIDGAWASPTPAGPPTACRRSATPTRT
jgi:glucosamine 6-phosphate synthetase-like amidotransferase/phosphosugar isomerase protein